MAAERTRVAVLLSGRGSNFAALVYASQDEACPYAIVAAISDRADAPGLAIARDERVPSAILPDEARWATLDRVLVDARVDVVALAGFMRILPASFVDRWAGRIVNVHPSLLPRHKGLHTHAAAIAAGDTHGGCSVHVVTAAIDDGPLLGQARVAIVPGDTPETLAARVLIAEHQLYPRVLARFAARQAGFIRTRSAIAAI